MGRTLIAFVAHKVADELVCNEFQHPGPVAPNSIKIRGNAEVEVVRKIGRHFVERNEAVHRLCDCEVAGGVHTLRLAHTAGKSFAHGAA